MDLDGQGAAMNIVIFNGDPGDTSFLNNSPLVIDPIDVDVVICAVAIAAVPTCASGPAAAFMEAMQIAIEKMQRRDDIWIHQNGYLTGMRNNP